MYFQFGDCVFLLLKLSTFPMQLCLCVRIIIVGYSRSNAKAYGKRNSTEGVILVRVKPTKIIADCYR